MDLENVEREDFGAELGKRQEKSEGLEIKKRIRPADKETSATYRTSRFSTRCRCHVINAALSLAWKNTSNKHFNAQERALQVRWNPQ